MVAIPPIMLNALDMKVGEDVRLEIDGTSIVIKSALRKGWALADLLLASDYDAPMTEDEREWVQAPPVGGELI